jgi:hypothetical protein
MEHYLQETPLNVIGAPFWIVSGVRPYTEPEDFVLNKQLERMIEAAEFRDEFWTTLFKMKYPTKILLT